MDKKYKRLAKNSFWTLIGNTGSKVLGFLLLPLYTRWLGTAGFGESDLVTTYSSFLVCIMTMCVADAIFVFTKNEDSDNKKVFFSTTLLFIIGVLFLWLMVWGCLDLGFSAYHVRNSFADNLWYIYGIVVTTFLQQYCQQFILSLDRIKIYSFTGIVHSLLTLSFSYWLIPVMGVRGYILAMIYSNLFTAAYSFLFSKSYSYISVKSVSYDKIYEVLKYSIPLIPNSIMWWLVSALNRPVMEYNLDYSAIGKYAVASRFPSVVVMVFTVFSVAWNISVFEEYGKDGYEVFYKKTFRILFVSMVLTASAFIVSSELIITIFTAPEFHDAWKYMVLLIIGSVISCMSSFFGSNFSVVKQSKYFFYSSVWGAMSAVALNFLLIPPLGLWGASISMLMSFVVMMVSRYIYSLKYVKSNLMYYVGKYILVMGGVAGITYSTLSIAVKLILVALTLTMLLLLEKEIASPVFAGVIKKLKR
jgi:O-antigen/teichoic acid export membrane protein